VVVEVLSLLQRSLFADRVGPSTGASVALHHHFSSAKVSGKDAIVEQHGRRCIHRTNTRYHKLHAPTTSAFASNTTSSASTHDIINSSSMQL